MGYTVMGEWHPCGGEGSIYMHAVRNDQLLTFCCPRTSSDSSPAVCRIRFSKRAFSIDFFRSVMSRMTQKAEVSDSAVQSTKVLREPIQTTE